MKKGSNYITIQTFIIHINCFKVLHCNGTGTNFIASSKLCHLSAVNHPMELMSIH